MLKTSWTAALPSYEPKHAGKKAKFWWGKILPFYRKTEKEA
jgi:hypothetical protein